MGRRKSLPLIEDLTITDMASEGKSLGKHEGKVVFVPLTAPGDVVDVQLVRKRKSYQEGKVVNFKSYSDSRVQPFCDHFGLCGGCKWQHVSYETQIRFKEQQVRDQFERIGKFPVGQWLPILGSENQQYYRNKLEFTFSDSRWLTQEEIESGQEIDRRALGFHIPGMFDRIVDVQHCYLQGGLSNEIRNTVKSYAVQKGYTFFNHKEKSGLLRNLIVRTTTLDEIMVVVVFYDDDTAAQQDIMQYIAGQFPQINALMYIVNQKANDTILDQDIHLYKGADCIYEQLEDLKFKIGPKSFFQTNTAQAQNLYSVVREMAGLTGSELVYDLYTGTGSIALFLARYCQKVVGIEYVEEAIHDALENASLNKIDNTVFFAGDMKDVLSSTFIEKNGRPDVLVTDPPRAGMHGDVVEKIKELAPQKIVYVSCNPATQARDIQLLQDLYTVEKVQPVDMFPHTHHVENVACLVKS